MARSPAEPPPSSDAESSTSTFDLTCVCGQKHAGQRRRRHQQIICKECGTPLFVLPLDVYPIPTASSGKKAKKKSAGGVRARQAVNRAAERTGEKAAAFGTALTSAFKWVFSPVKLAIYAVLIAVALTGWFLNHRQVVANAERDVIAEPELGKAALKDGNFDLAAEHFHKAAAAIQVLGLDDEHSRRIVQLSRETQTISHLAPTSIIDLVRRVDQAGVTEDHFWKPPERISFENQWVAFDASVEKRGDKLAVALPVTVGDRKNIFIRIDSPAFDNIPFEDTSRTLTFAGQVASVEQLSSSYNVVMDPNSLFLWESPGLYAELGFVMDPIWNTPSAVEARLMDQRIWQGGEPLPEDDAVIDNATSAEPTAEDDQ